jgi:hypothetical protein
MTATSGAERKHRRENVRVRVYVLLIAFRWGVQKGARALPGRGERLYRYAKDILICSVAEFCADI